MGWLKRKSKKIPSATAGQAVADKALHKAEEGLREANQETSEILATAEELKRLGERNDFAARIREAMGGA